MPGCVRLDYALPHHTTHHAHQGSSFWSILDAFCFSSLSSRESGICDEKVEGLRILDSQRLPFGASWKLLVSLSSPRENREFVEGRAGSSEFSILRDCVFKSTLDASPCENRESVDRGLGGAELVILREDFSGEGGGELLFHHLNLSTAIC